MPTGYESGKAWSPIGAQATVSTSAASRVWTLNEVAAYEGAGTWPAPKQPFEPIAQYVADGSTGLFSFTSIPQTYRSLRIVMANGKRVGSGTNISMFFNSDSTSGNYGYASLYGAGTTANYLSSRNSGSFTMGNCPTGGVNDSQIWVCDITNYSNASVGTMCQIWQGANEQGGNNTGLMGYGYSVASAITDIEINSSGYDPGLLYNYDTPTVFTLFGIGSV